MLSNVEHSHWANPAICRTFSRFRIRDVGQKLELLTPPLITSPIIHPSLPSSDTEKTPISSLLSSLTPILTKIEWSTLAWRG